MPEKIIVFKWEKIEPWDKVLEKNKKNDYGI